MSSCSRCGTPVSAGARFCARCGTPADAGGGLDPTCAPETAPDPLVGRNVIGQYVIRSKLGEGGMGAVYLAEQPSVGRTAVIKVMHPQFGRDPKIAPRFEMEARAAAKLTNAHIVAIYNYGDMGDGTLFLAMEHLAGRTMDQELAQRGPMAPARALRIMAQCCEALGEAHGAGIVHRDLKPPNIMLVERGRDPDFVKVLDFGIAKLEGVKMTATGAVFGTPQYMSPEQLRGEPLDGRSDLYALGVILYELVCGRLPFESNTPAGYMHKHLTEQPPSMRTLVPHLHVPAALESVVRRLLAKKASDRPRSADALGEEIAQLLAELGPDGSVPRTAQRTRSATRGRAAFAAGGIVVLGAAVALVVWHDRKPPPPGPAPAAAMAAAAPAVAASPVADKPAEPPPSTPETPTPRVGAIPPRPPRAHAPAATGQPPPAVPPAKASGGRPLTELPPEVAALTTESIDTLSNKLDKLKPHIKIPPSMIRKSLEAFELSARTMAPEQRDATRRQMLAQLISAYQQPNVRLSALEEHSLADLTAQFMSVETKTPMSEDIRRGILKRALETYDQDQFAPEDRDLYKRMAVAGLITNMRAQNNEPQPAANMRLRP
jgi:serine/threonine-protein kinase